MRRAIEMREAPLPHSGVLTRLGPSPIHGVGVFAMCAIAKGTELFAHDVAEIRWINAAQLNDSSLQPYQQAFYRDFAVRHDGKLGCPKSFDLLTPGWYLNEPLEGEPPNVCATVDLKFVVASDISVGEELTVVYETLTHKVRWK